MTVLDKLPDLVNAAFKGMFYDAVMTVEVPGEVDTERPFDPVAPTVSTFNCKAYVERYSAYYRANSLVEASDRKVIVLAQSLGREPVRGARITIRGITFTIIDYDDGGSNRSVWEIQGRM